MSLPVLFEARTSDLRDAVERVRTRVGALKQPRLYWAAVALTVLARQGKIASWRAWDSIPPASAGTIGRRQVVAAMRELFEAPAGALIHRGSAVDIQLDKADRLMLDVLFGANGPLSLIGRRPLRGQGSRDSVKLELDNPCWVWSKAGPGAAASRVTVFEYNPVNSFNQQNGIGCALPITAALQSKPHDLAAAYAKARTECPSRSQVAGSEPKCSINEKICGGQGAGDEAGRRATKPRLLAPATEGESGDVILPDSIRTLSDLATDHSQSYLPAAADLALITSWCYTGGAGIQDSTRLPSLLGAEGISLLTGPE
jgi:hypothetical protein